MLEEQYLLLAHEELDQNRQVHLHANEPAHVQLALESLEHSVLQSRLITLPAALEGQKPGQARLRKLLCLFL